MFAATSCNARDIRNNHGKRLVWRHKAEIRFQSRQKEETCSEHPQGIVAVMMSIPNLHQWNASPKFSIQILLVPMGSESMQCLVEVETQSFEIKHLLPWSHHVALKRIRVLRVLWHRKAYSLELQVYQVASWHRKSGHFAIFAKRFCHFVTKVWTPRTIHEGAEGAEGVRTSISLPIKPCERAASFGAGNQMTFLTNSTIILD